MHTIETVAALQSVLATSKEANHTIWTILLYRDDDPEGCPHGIRAREDLESILPTIQRDFYEEASSPLRLGFAVLPVRQPLMRLLKTELGIETVPTILFFRNQVVAPLADPYTKPSSKHARPPEPVWWAIEYKGSFRSPSALFEGLSHYWSRFGNAPLRNRQRWLPKPPQPPKATTTGKARPSSSRQQQQYLESLTVSVASLDRLRSLLESTIPPLFPASPGGQHRRNPPLDPHLSQDEQDTIRELLRAPPDDDDTDRWVLCRCEGADPRVAEAFDALAYVMSKHHDLLFCLWTEDCSSHLPSGGQPASVDEDDEDDAVSDRVSILRLSSSSSSPGLELVAAWNPLLDPAHQGRAPSDPVGLMDPLANFLSSLLRPAVMWMDRYSTAPIAFRPQYTTHATLFVDTHPDPNSDDVEQHNRRREERLVLTRSFSRLCREHQQEEIEHALGGLAGRNLPPSPPQQHPVCLVVPSTETRILTTFGIDIWSDLDRELLVRLGRLQPTDNNNTNTESNEDENSDDAEQPVPTDDRSEGDARSTTESVLDRDPVLPVLLVTNRTETEGLQRFYLDPPFSPEEDMPAFVWDVLAGRVAPELQTATGNHRRSGEDPDRPTRNAHHVSEWTSLHLHRRRRQAVGTEPESTEAAAAHVLLMIYAPTCGHCKRLKIAWNTLGRLVHSLGWGDWLEIAQLDVSREEFTAMGASLLPSVYYYYSGPLGDEDDNEASGGGTTNGRDPVWFDSGEAGAVSDPLVFLDWLLEVGHGLELQPLIDSLEKSLEEDESQEQQPP